jgi:molecular chaperone DnaJ
MGDDLVCEVPINFTQAALGDSIMVPTLYGKVKMNIPEGTQTHSIFRLRGKGMPHLHGHGQGDQHVRVVVKTPKKLTSEQKKLLEELANSGEDFSRSGKGGKGFFDKMKDVFEG